MFRLATPICIYPLFEDCEEQKFDRTNLNEHKITFARDIRRLFLVSDNEVFNRLYGVVGYRSLNQIMQIADSMDFSFKNYVSLMDLQNLLLQLVRPDIELLKPGTPALQIGGGVQMMLLEAMSQYPASSFNPHDGAEYPDDYGKVVTLPTEALHSLHLKEFFKCVLAYVEDPEKGVFSRMNLSLQNGVQFGHSWSLQECLAAVKLNLRIWKVGLRKKKYIVM